VDQSTLVGIDIDDGRRVVERFAADGNPVQAAFWAKSDEDQPWYLHIATEIVDRDGPLAAYRAVQASRDKLGDPDLRSLSIRLDNLRDPLAKRMIALIAEYPGRTRIRPDGPGLSSVEVAYVYPAHLFTLTRHDPMTEEDLGRELFRLMSRKHGLIQPAHVALKDGTAFDGVPFAVQLGGEKSLIVQFIVDRKFAPRVVGLEEIASIA